MDEEVPTDVDYRIRRDAVSLAIESKIEHGSGDWGYIEARAVRIEQYLRTGDFNTRRR